tara:strand:+ start:843 stop:1034 length:192 start_codon:yes stop_codon:yes gene_type:complete
MIVINIGFYLLLSVISFYFASGDARKRYYQFLGDTVGVVVQRFFSTLGAIFLFLIIPEVASLV